jgi:hypothetical protein
MQQIVIAQGNFGDSYNLRPFPVSGIPFSQADLASATYNLQIFRHDTTRLPIDLTDTRIYLLKDAKMELYAPDQTITINGELMSVQALFIDVVRTVQRKHKARTRINHVVYTSPSEIEWNPTTNQAVLTISEAMATTLLPGNYKFEVQITTGDRQATARGNHPNSLYTIKILEDAAGV